MKSAEYSRRWRQANPEKVREYQRRYSAKHPDRKKASQKKWRNRNVATVAFWDRKNKLKQRYGLSIEEYTALIAKGCGICESHGKLHIDHNHFTDRVREALCENCNRGIGMFAESPQRLRAAALYIERHLREEAS